MQLTCGVSIIIAVYWKICVHNGCIVIVFYCRTCVQSTIKNWIHVITNFSCLIIHHSLLGLVLPLWTLDLAFCVREKARAWHINIISCPGINEDIMRRDELIEFRF